MNPNLTSIIALLALGTPVLIVIMFLPAVFELKKPKDRGPRLIMDDSLDEHMRLVGAVRFVNIEEEQRFDGSIIQSLMAKIDFLPSLEV